MKTLKTRWIAAAALGLMAAGGAAAQGTWNLGGAGCNPGGSPAAVTCNAGSGFNATMKAYSNTATVGSAFAQANMMDWGANGLGGMSGSEVGAPDHAFDNITGVSGQSNPANNREGGTQEFMLLDFASNKVTLSSLSIGWWASSADMSIYRWDGNTVNTAGTAGALHSDWKLVSSMDAFNNGVTCDNPNVAGADTQCRRFDASAGTLGSGGLNKYSSWWLVSTYSGTATTSGLDGTLNDAFKLLSFTATTCAGSLSGGSTSGNGASCNSVPEPGSLALAGVALSGVYALRRRRPAVALKLAA